MGIKLKPDITVNIARTCDVLIYPSLLKSDYDVINIHLKDGKRIVQGKVWNSRKFHNDGDDFICVMLVRGKRIYNNIRVWLLHLKDLKNGETRVTPMYEVEIIKYTHTVSTNNGDKNYILFKKK